MDSERERVRGRAAEVLLQEPLLIEILDAIEKQYETAWKASQLHEVNKREEAYRMLISAQVFRAHLQKVVNTGKLAAESDSESERIADQQRRLEGWDGSADTLDTIGPAERQPQ